MEDELVSESNNSFLTNSIGLVALLGLSLMFFSMAIVEVYWLGLLGGLIPLTGILTTIPRFHKKIYYFKEDKVLVANYKNDFVDELNLDEFVTWNEYSEYQRFAKRNFLIISNNYKSIVIDKYDYKNYDKILSYLNNKPLVKNQKLTPYSVSNKIVSALEEQRPVWVSCTIAIVIFSFFLITSSKKQTKEIKYFTGKIKSIEYFRNNNYIEITLNNNPNLFFRFKDRKDVDFFNKYNYDNGENTYVNLGRYIQVGVSKDDYSWKIENKMISRIDLNSTPYLDVQEYKISK